MDNLIDNRIDKNYCNGCKYIQIEQTSGGMLDEKFQIICDPKNIIKIEGRYTHLPSYGINPNCNDVKTLSKNQKLLNTDCKIISKIKTPIWCPLSIEKK